MSETPVPTLGPNRAREETARRWRKRRSRLRRVLRRAGDVALIALAIVAIVFGLQRAHGGGGGKGSPTSSAAPGSVDARYPPMQDVKITGCNYWKSLYAGGVTLSVLNHSPIAWTYYVDVQWVSGAKKFSETVLHSKRVPGYHSLRMGGFGLAPNHTPPTRLKCSVLSVRRVGT
jgi:hypothetical protein